MKNDIKEFQRTMKYVNENFKENSKEFIFIKNAIKEGFDVNNIKTSISLKKYIEDGSINEDTSKLSQDAAFKMVVKVWNKNKSEKKDNDKEYIEHIKNNMNTLFENLNSPDADEKIKDYFKTVAKFNNYSYNNIIFLHEQAKDRNRSITFVDSAKNWSEKGVSINKDEKSLKLFAPKKNYEYETETINGIEKYKKDNNGKYIFKLDDQGNKIEKGVSFILVPVFDANQTNAYEKGVVNELEYRDKNNDISDDMLKDIVEEIKTNFDVSIEMKELKDYTIGGYYEPDNKSITINSKKESNSQKVSTLFHELGHHILHNKENYDAIHLNRGIKEGEAESVAYILSSKLNIENNSELYLKTWGNDIETINKQLERITNASKNVLNKIDFDTIMEKEYYRIQSTKILENMLKNSVIDESYKDKFKNIASDDYQNRNGNYPRENIPVSINFENKDVDKFNLSISFKNTSEEVAKKWCERNITTIDNKLNYDIKVYQDGDYNNDWIEAFIKVNNPALENVSKQNNIEVKYDSTNKIIDNYSVSNNETLDDILKKIDEIQPIKLEVVKPSSNTSSNDNSNDLSDIKKRSNNHRQ